MIGRPVQRALIVHYVLAWKYVVLTSGKFVARAEGKGYNPLVKTTHLQAITYYILHAEATLTHYGPGQSRILSRDECLSYVASKVSSKYAQNHASKVVNVFQHDPAYLHCKIPLQSVNNLVAWTRLADDALLTVGRRPFSTDTRFQISPKREARDWILNIRRVQLSDAGCYLCAVNTEPQSSIFTVYLNVISRDETTPASTEKSKRKAIVTAKLQGNTILLNCSVEADRHSALDIIWTKNGNTINFLNDTKYKTDFKLLDKTVIYMLTVLDPSKDDDGSYECQGENVATAAEMVHVNSGCYKPGTCFTLLILLFSTLMVAYQV